MTDIHPAECQQAAICALMHDEGVIAPPITLAHRAGPRRRRPRG